MYLSDHENDAWDGLRDRGWIYSSDKNSNFLADNFSNNSSLSSQDLSWWDFIKQKIFGIDLPNSNSGSFYSKDLSQINNDNTINTLDKINSENLSHTLSKTNNSFFSELHFSIQNPILSFVTDIITIISFFLFLVLIYAFWSWLWLSIKGNFKSDDEKYKEKKEKIKNIEENKIAEKKVKHVYTFDEKLNLTDEEKLKKIRQIQEELKLLENEDEKKVEQKIIKEERGEVISFDIPAGIAGLPIDMSEFDDNEKFEIKKNQEKINLEENNLKDWRERWERIQKYMQGSEEALWRIAIMESDNLLNDILIDREYTGETVAEKLKNAKFRTIDLAWELHKMRNRIAHDGAKFELSESVARKHIAMFESVLIEFRVL